MTGSSVFVDPDDSKKRGVVTDSSDLVFSIRDGHPQ